jgi:hypothetical protein
LKRIFEIRLMKQTILYISIVVTLFSCYDDGLRPNILINHSSDVIITYPEEIDRDLIVPEIGTYHENISQLTRWYARHPLNRKFTLPLTATDPVNTVLQKLGSMILIDSSGKQLSIFDLNANELQNFLNSWKSVESFELSQKLRKDPTRLSLELFINRNEAFNKVYGNLKSVEIESEDPYFKVKKILDEQEKKAIELQIAPPLLKSGEYTDNNFWATVVSNNLMSFSPIQFAPNERSPQTFVDNIRPNIKKGRLLIALPGGWSTGNLLVLYPNKVWYDVGHVAFITKPPEEIPDSIDDDFNFTVGTGVRGTEYEETGFDWCKKHGMSFLGQVCQVRWEIYKTKSNKWSWRKITTDADNELLASEAEKYIGVPYCGVVDVFFSKWVAPKSFICSSIAWYCVKEKTGLNISDWWSPTVFPRDIFFSEQIRIIDDTLE